MSENRQSVPLVRIEPPSLLLGLADEHEPGFFIIPHKHDSAQLIYATEGVMTVETDDGAWVVPPERAVWVPALVTHSIRMTGRVRMRTLYVRASAAPIPGTHCCVVQISDLLRACIARFFEFPSGWAEPGPEARLVAVLLDELHAAPTAPLHLPMPRDPRANRVAAAFRSDPSQRRSIREWAKRAGTSERTFERLWHAEVNMTFGRWQQQARLLRALEVLASGKSVMEAALDVGFETPSSFIAMFRRAMGTTPARYFRDSTAADARASSPAR
jgi:AraC-like DNA-binding protein